MKSSTAKTVVGFRNILFATDFSPAATRAIPYVKKIAKHYDAALVALHVQSPVVDPMTEPGTWPIYLEAAKAHDEQRREELLNSFAGIPTVVLLEEGSIQNCLAEAIKEHNTDLVVIGTRGRTGVEKLLLGSVAEEIFRTVPCPVLTVGPRAYDTTGVSGQFREILYATDFSEASLKAAAYAVSLAQEFQSRLVLLHVIVQQRPGDLVSAADLTAASQKLLRQSCSAAGPRLVQARILRRERRGRREDSGICHAKRAGSHCPWRSTGGRCAWRGIPSPHCDST
jgi:nucleotide-binding universal stress UspA family protein